MPSKIDVIGGLERVSRRDEFHLSPPETERRSSVAVIVRIPGLRTSTPTFSELLVESQYTKIDAQDAEILFIKRASSERDRWSSHIAVPGGRRDPADKSDIAAAVREAYEEVGLDLEKNAVYVGPLDQRLVKVSMGSKIIMTLCPFVFLMTDPDAELHLQESEVATAFWHPIRELLDPQNAGYEKVNVGHRMHSPLLPIWANQLVASCIGDVLFGSVTLRPHELKHKHTQPIPPPPYQLWGLTLGFLTDFFELIEPGRTSKVVRLPTMRAWDMRAVVYLLSHRHVSQRYNNLERSIANGYGAGQMSLVDKLLDGYFWYLSRGIVLSLALRLSVGSAFIFYIYRRIRKL